MPSLFLLYDGAVRSSAAQYSAVTLSFDSEVSKAGEEGLGDSSSSSYCSAFDASSDRLRGDELLCSLGTDARTVAVCTVPISIWY